MPEYTMKQYKDKIDRWMKQYPHDAQVALKAAAEVVRAEVQSNHLAGPKMAQGVGSKTHGTLQPGRGSTLMNSITTEVSRSGGRMSAVIGNIKRPLVYARIHEYGGIIRPKKPGGRLVFKIGDRLVFAKQVKIPERSYLRSSLKAKKRTVLTMILQAIKRSYNNV